MSKLWIALITMVLLAVAGCAAGTGGAVGAGAGAPIGSGTPEYGAGRGASLGLMPM